MLEFLRRFSFPKLNLPQDKRVIWIHTPSVGEFNTFKPLLEFLKNDETFVVLTYFSPRAEAFLKKIIPPQTVLLPLPFPFGGFIKKFNEFIKPHTFILVESDRFPELLNVRAERKILVNARISNKSFKLLKMLKPIYRSAFNTFDKIICKSNEDYEKFLKLGVKTDKLTICGNLKAVWKPSLGNINISFPKNVKIITAGSTHPGEEKIIIKTYKRLKQKIPNLVLILAPRHIERIGEIEKLLKQYKLNYSLRSSFSSKNMLQEFREEVLLIDTLGELLSFYKVADVCIVGGTFSPIGGHNILEPAYFGKPVIYGPNIWKFKDLEDLLEEIGLGFKTSEDDLEKLLLHLLEKTVKPKRDLKEISKQILECYLRYTVNNPAPR